MMLGTVMKRIKVGEVYSVAHASRIVVVAGMAWVTTGNHEDLILLACESRDIAGSEGLVVISALGNQDVIIRIEQCAQEVAA